MFLAVNSQMFKPSSVDLTATHGLGCISADVSSSLTWNLSILRCYPFAIINIVITNCNLITHFFSVTVTDYSYIYFVIKSCNSITCN